MGKKTSNPVKQHRPSLLHTIAEAQLADVPHGEGKSLRPTDELSHELHEYQVGLETQNEKLRQMQIDLEESRDRYMNLYEFAPVVYLTLNAAGLIGEINLTGSSLFKVERNRLLCKSFNHFVTPEYFDRWNRLFVGVLQTGGAKNCELVLKNGDGGSFHAYLDCMQYVTDGKPPMVRITLTDITPLRQAEESMHEWHKFVEHANWGMTIGSLEDRTIRLVNPAYARMHGYTAEELRNIRTDILYAPESRASLPYYVECVRKDGCHTFECVRLRKDGSMFPAVVDISTLGGIDGKTTALVSVKDITKRKSAELQLIESEQQYRTLADSGQALIWASGTDKQLNYFNRIWLDFTGRTLEQELGNGWVEGIHPDDLQRCLAVYVQAFDQREKFSMDHRLRHHDGHYHWVQDCGCPRYNSKGEFIGYIGYGLDISERKQVEQQLRDLTTHLQSVRENEKASIAREIHDDLGGTLTTLKMETYWLKTKLSKDSGATPLLDHVWEISKLIDHASGVMRNIITGLRPTILDDLGLLAALEWQATQFQKHTGIKCRVNCIGDKGDLDKSRSIELFRISQEALANVMRHSGASSVEIEYHHGDDEVVMSIIDNGHGLQERLADASIPYGIMGMNERADQLGGKIRFNTPPDGGFDVTVMLPLSTNEKEKI